MNRLKMKTTATLLIAIFMISAIAIVVPTFAKNKSPSSTFILGSSEVIVPEGFVPEVFASGFFAEDMVFDDLGDLYVATFQWNTERGWNWDIPNGQVLKIDVLPNGKAGRVTVLFNDLDTAAGLTYSSSGEFGEYLYVSESGWTNHEGRISKVDVTTGSITTFAEGLDENVEGLAFGPGGEFGTDLFACYNGITTFDSNGNPTHFSDQWAEELVFDTTGLFGGDLYIATYAVGLFRVDQYGIAHPFGDTELKGADGLAFGPGGAWGNDLYAVQLRESNHIYRIAPDGTVSVFATFIQPNWDPFFEELIFDSSGNLFVATQLEGVGDCIVKISPPPLTRGDVLQDKGIPGKGIDNAPGLDKPLPNDNFARVRQDVPPPFLKGNRISVYPDEVDVEIPVDEHSFVSHGWSMESWKDLSKEDQNTFKEEYWFKLYINDEPVELKEWNKYYKTLGEEQDVMLLLFNIQFKPNSFGLGTYTFKGEWWDGSTLFYRQIEVTFIP